MHVTNNCYVTGKDLTTTYYFGSADHVILNLTQDAFAHFVIRAGKDTMHSQIMADVKAAVEAAQKKALVGKSALPNSDEYIDARIEYAMCIDKLGNLLTQKCESGVRILRAMKADYKKTGKLSS
jgi:DNA-binding transcriptional regulator YbjK